MTGRVFDLPQASQARSEATRARFVEAALRLLALRAWEAISIEDLVEEADLSVGAFYKRFRVKDDVLAACIEAALAEGRSLARELLSTEGDLSARIEALVSALSAGWARRGAIVRAAMSMKDPAHLAALADESAAMAARLAEWLLERREEFTHPDSESAIAAGFRVVLGGLQHALAHGGLEVDRTRLQREAAQMLRGYFMGGVVTP